jgi:hypothetical protein
MIKKSPCYLGRGFLFFYRIYISLERKTLKIGHKKFIIVHVNNNVLKITFTEEPYRNKIATEKLDGYFNIYFTKKIYLYNGIIPFANSTIFFKPSSGKAPFLKSAITSGNLLFISVKKCSSNSFTFFTATFFIKPCVPK